MVAMEGEAAFLKGGTDASNASRKAARPVRLNLLYSCARVPRNSDPMKPNSDWIRVCALAFGFASLQSSAAEPTLVDIGPGTGVAINNQGTVLRNYSERAYLHRGATVIPIQVKNNWQPELVEKVTAVDLSDSEIVVGIDYPTFADPSGFWWTATGSKDGEVPVSASSTQIRRINSEGFAAVYQNTGFGGAYPFWPQLLTYQWYPDFVGIQGPTIGRDMLGINDARVMVGYGVRPEALLERARAVKVVGDVMTFLDTRDPGTGQYAINDPVTRLSEAFGINEGGVVVGRMAITPGGPKHAFRWIEGSGMQALGTLGGLESEALDVNDSGLIVGRSQVANGEWHACAYLNGSLVDLNTYVPAGVSAVLMRANRVNNQAQIVGDMLLNGSTNVYVLSLNPAATPATITQQPSSKTVALGETVTFSVMATGQLPIQFQWWRNNEKLDAATNSVLTLESVNGLSEGEYRVDVINPGGSISSLPASLTVLDPELTPYSLAGLSMVGQVGGMYRIDYRTTMSTPWVPLATVQLTNNPQWFIDLESATNRSRIYRSVRLAN